MLGADPYVKVAATPVVLTETTGDVIPRFIEGKFPAIDNPLLTVLIPGAIPVPKKEATPPNINDATTGPMTIPVVNRAAPTVGVMVVLAA